MAACSAAAQRSARIHEKYSSVQVQKQGDGADKSTAAAIIDRRQRHARSDQRQQPQLVNPLTAFADRKNGLSGDAAARPVALPLQQASAADLRADADGHSSRGTESDRRQYYDPYSVSNLVSLA